MYWVFLWEFVLFCPVGLAAQTLVFGLRSKRLYLLSHLTHPFCDALLHSTSFKNSCKLTVLVDPFLLVVV